MTEAKQMCRDQLSFKDLFRHVIWDTELNFFPHPFITTLVHVIEETDGSERYTGEIDFI